MYDLDETGQSVIHLIGEALVHKRILQENPCYESSEGFTNDVFLLEPFDWDYESKPNFIYFGEEDLIIEWHRDITRAAYMNYEEVSFDDWMMILNDCLDSIGLWDGDEDEG